MLESDLLQSLLQFRHERDWKQFHKPKDLAISLSLEASELLEWFQWKTDHEIEQNLESPKRLLLEQEIADVAIYLSYLCHDLGVDINDVVKQKLAMNEEKYPASLVKGRHDKYDQY